MARDGGTEEDETDLEVQARYEVSEEDPEQDAEEEEEESRRIWRTRLGTRPPRRTRRPPQRMDHAGTE